MWLEQDKGLETPLVSEADEEDLDCDSALVGKDFADQSEKSSLIVRIDADCAGCRRFGKKHFGQQFKYQDPLHQSLVNDSGRGGQQFG